MGELDFPKLFKQVVSQHFFFARVESMDPAQIPELLPVLNELHEAGLKDGELAVELTKLFRSMKLVRLPVEADHFLKNWFSEWFPNQPVASIVLEAAIVACKRATEDGARLPITGYWVASADKRVKVAVCKSARQVTLLLITPQPATKVMLDGDKLKPAPVWITQADRRGRVGTTQVQIGPLKQGDSDRRGKKAAPKSAKVAKRKRKAR